MQPNLTFGVIRDQTGIVALLGALQPLAVAIGSVTLLGDRLSARAWTGLGNGLTGVVLVLASLLGDRGRSEVLPIVAFAAVTSILAMAAGTMIQRGSITRDPMRISAAVQNSGGALVAIAATTALGDFRRDGAAEL